jgi:hypothetical protein
MSWQGRSERWQINRASRGDRTGRSGGQVAEREVLADAR